MLKGEKKGDIALMPGSSDSIFLLVALNGKTQPRTALFEDLLSNGITRPNRYPGDILRGRGRAAAKRFHLSV